MTLQEKWLAERKCEKEVKTKEANDLNAMFSQSDSALKLNELTSLFMDCYDLMTKLGGEIAEIADKNNSGNS